MCSPENYKEIIRKFREYAAEKQIKGFYSMMHVFFARRPTVSPQGSWWTLSMQNYGVGRSEEEATNWWGTCVRYTKEFLLTQRS